jgi:fructose/tagatose bisphosphate aldolase
MHGSSSVPQELLAIIREFGGDMKETYGVPVEEIQEGIKYGVRKINIDTDIRLAMTGAMRASWPRTVQVRPARLPEAGPRSRQAGARRASCPSAAKARLARSSRSRWKRWPSVQERRAGADRQVS